MPDQPHPLILASASPRRAALLRGSGYAFEVVVSGIEEPAPSHAGLHAGQYAESVAYFKARAVAAVHPGAWVLGADTIVVHGEQVIGKAADADDARRILSGLSGAPHACITGVVLLSPGGQHRIIRHDTTELLMRALTAAEIDAYVAGGEWRGKAGAYAMQETGDRFLTIQRGSRSNVVGLPMEVVGAMLAEAARVDGERVMAASVERLK